MFIHVKGIPVWAQTANQPPLGTLFLPWATRLLCLKRAADVSQLALLQPAPECLAAAAVYCLNRHFLAVTSPTAAAG